MKGKTNQARVKDPEVPCAERWRGRGHLRALGSEGWGRAQGLFCAGAPGMHTCEDMWQFPYGRMVHQTHFTARVVSPAVHPVGGSLIVHMLWFDIVSRPDTQPSMPEGLGPRVPLPPPVHTHTHTHSPSPVLGYAPEVYFLTGSRSGYRLCSEHLRLRKSCCLAQGGPAPLSITKPGLYGHPGRPSREAGAPSPQCTLAALPAAILLLPWVSLLPLPPR